MSRSPEGYGSGASGLIHLAAKESKRPPMIPLSLLVLVPSLILDGDAPSSEEQRGAVGGVLVAIDEGRFGGKCRENVCLDADAGDTIYATGRGPNGEGLDCFGTGPEPSKHLPAEIALLTLRHRAHLFASLVSDTSSFQKLVHKFTDTDTMVTVTNLPVGSISSGEFIELDSHGEVTSCIQLTFKWMTVCRDERWCCNIFVDVLPFD